MCVGHDGQGKWGSKYGPLLRSLPVQGWAGGDHGVHRGLLGDGLILQIFPLKLLS